MSGCLGTIEALGGQKALAEQLGEHAGEYVLALKQTHEPWYAAVGPQLADARDPPSEAAPLQVSETEEQRHGRGEIRRHGTLEAPPDLGQKDAWTQLRWLGMVESERQLNGQVTREHRSSIASIPNEVRLFAPAVRAHWGSENGVPWVRAVAFREDESRVRLGQAPENFAVLRPIALNLLRQDTSPNLGIHNQRLKAGWEDASLANLVFGHTF